MKKIGVILTVLILVACTKTFDVQLEPKVSVLLSHDTSKVIELTAKDEEYVLLNKWLQAHRNDWLVTSGRYPKGVYIKSGDHGIQITGTSIVIYSTTGSELQALYVQNISEQELKEIRNIGSDK